MRACLVAAALLTLAVAASAEESREWLIAGPLKSKGRGLVASDPALEMLFGGETPRWPKAGDKIGDVEWKKGTPNADGVIEGEELAPGAAYTVVQSGTDRVALLAFPGAGTVYVDGVAVVADVYSTDLGGFPVLLHKGDNHVLGRCGRGVASLTLSDPPAPVFLMESDITLPERFEGVNRGKWGAIPVVNATNEFVRGATLEYGKVSAPLPPLAPLSIYKAPFLVGDEAEVVVRVVAAGKAHEVKAKLLEPKESRGFRRTFRSRIDRSVQIYGELEPANFDPEKTYALLFSLHGAGVGADGQARAYFPRDWCAVVAPSNRRPYGFNWEEWGRLDGLEVLEQAKKDFHVDPARICLTGHSMGGHGAWHFAVTYPDRWACVAPSAGWVSLWTYPGPARDPAADYGSLFRASAATSDTMALVRNLEALPVYILHGTKDETVPPAQAELMVEALKKFHHDWRYTPVEGKGHWWGGPEPGADCLTYSDMTDWMQRQHRADDPTRWEFRTFSPSVSSSCRGFEILAQKKPYTLSWVKAREDETAGRFFETGNAVHVRVKTPAQFTLDGQELKAGEYHRGADGKWEAGAPAGLHKSPELQGPFTQAFHTPFLLVTPSLGDAAETRDCLARARFDAEVWWYRGNGRARVAVDTDVTAKDWKDFNLVLYGSADSNACWKKIADRLPFRAGAGEVKIGADVLKGDLALAAVYPNPDVPANLVAVVGATGAAGRRAWHALGWWHNDTGSPDLLCWGPDIHEKWMDAIRAVGYYGADWKPADGMWDVKK